MGIPTKRNRAPYVSMSKLTLIKAAQRCGRVKGAALWRTDVVIVEGVVALLATGGPPVPITESGFMAFEGAWISAIPFGGEGVDDTFITVWLESDCIVGTSLTVESCLIWANGMLSSSRPSSSARSVMARLEVPRASWRPRTIYAVKAKTATYPMTAESQRKSGEMMEKKLTEDGYNLYNFHAAYGRTERQGDERRAEEDVDIS
jgi:hypothetical protein